MKLDRNITNPRRGKYALIKLRESSITPHLVAAALAAEKREVAAVAVEAKAIDFGDTDDTDFFVIRLKDKYAAEALFAYASEAVKDDCEYGEEILTLARLAENHRSKRKPD